MPFTEIFSACSAIRKEPIKRPTHSGQNSELIDNMMVLAAQILTTGLKGFSSVPFTNLHRVEEKFVLQLCPNTRLKELRKNRDLYRISG
jgi:hypothetical protein